MTYREACDYLGREPAQRPSVGGGRPPGKPAWEPRACSIPGNLWREQARRLVDKSVHHLWATTGKAALSFLVETKGLTGDIIKRFSLGWIPSDRSGAAPAWGLPEVLKDTGKAKRLWFPKGVSIPLLQGGQVVRVRVRRPDGEPRYYILRGSSTQAMLIGDGNPVAVVVESELCGLLLHQEAGDLVNLVALGNAQTRPDRQAAALLKRSRLILVALDADRAGAQEAWRWWKDHYHQAHRWPPIQGKDPGEMLAHGVNLRVWVQAGLAEYGGKEHEKR